MVKHSLAPSLGRKVQEQIMLMLFHLVTSSSSVLPCLANKDSDTAMVSQGGSKSPASLLCPGRHGQQGLRTDHSHASPDLPGRALREESSQAPHCSAGSCQHLRSNAALPLQSPLEEYSGGAQRSTEKHRVWRSNVGAVGPGWFLLL